MNVFILMGTVQYEGTDVLEVFQHKEDAEKEKVRLEAEYKKNRKNKVFGGYDHFNILEFKVS